MSTYTKLFGSILDSSIWQEDDRTRLVWITMLAMADHHGEIQASIPGVAKRAGVPLDAAEAAIRKLSSPDAYSRTPDNEGRRIAKIDGGWEVLNHAKYRFMASLEDRKERALERQRRRRNKLQKPEGENTTACDSALQGVTGCDLSRCVTLLDDSQSQSQSQSQHTHPLTPTGGVPVEEPPKEEPKAKRTRKQRDPNSIPEGFAEFWEAYPRKMAKGDAIKAWGQMEAGQHLPKILETVKASAKLEAWTKDGGRFVPFPATWLRAQRWEDELSIFVETKAQLMEKIKANRGWPNHPDHAHATEEEKALQVELAARWRSAE